MSAFASEKHLSDADAFMAGEADGGDQGDEAGGGDGWNEPRYDASADLCEAFCGDTDIIELLSDEQREQIEIAFLEQDQND